MQTFTIKNHFLDGKILTYKEGEFLDVKRVDMSTLADHVLFTPLNDNVVYAVTKGFWSRNVLKTPEKVVIYLELFTGGPDTFTYSRYVDFGEVPTAYLYCQAMEVMREDSTINAVCMVKKGAGTIGPTILRADVEKFL